MGKSIKKSATKVDVAPVAATQSGKKGKRGAENEIEKALSAKKQKVERNETVIAKQKAEKKIVKKAPSSSSEDDSDSDSDSEPEVAVKKTPAPAKNGSAVAKKPTAESSSDSSSDSDSEDEKPAAKKGPAAVKNGSVAAKKTPAADSSDSSSDDESDDEKPAAAVKNVASKKPASSSDESEDDSDSSEEEEPKKVAAQPKKDPKKSAESSDSDDDSSDDEDVAKAAPVAAPKAKVDSDSTDEEEDSSDSDEEPKATKPKVQAATKSDSSDEDDESSSDDEEEENVKTPKKKDTDVEMVDAQNSAASTFQKTPKTPATSEATGSKTLFAGNLSFSIEESDVHEFFKGAGEVVDVRFAVDQDGKFKGFGHVEFATAEAAQKALEMHQQDLVGRPVRLDLAHERGASQSRDNTSSFQKGGRAQGSTAFIRGFDTSLGEDDIRSALQEHFGPCGESTRISIPPDYDNGGVKGVAYIDFVDSKALSAALELDGSDLGGGYFLNVQEAKPRGDSSGGGGRGGRGRFGDDSGGRGGRFSGGRGGRFGGGRGGRDGGRGGRFSGGRGGRDGGRGGRTPFRSSVPSGKKTTFGDD